MTICEELASFVLRASYDDLSPEARMQLKIRVLDSLGCAIGAMDGPPVRLLKKQTDDFGGNPQCSLIGGGRTSPDRAALYNGALVRYLDFNDSYLAKNETCHPSDNLAAVLAASEYAQKAGKDLLRRIEVRPNATYSERFPAQVPCLVSVKLRNGAVHVNERKDYKGFYTNPMNWDDVVGKFMHLGNGRIDASLCMDIIDAVGDLDAIRVEEVVRPLARIL